MAITLSDITAYRVSSVLNRDTKSFGKTYLLDGMEDTCWNSEKGSPQWISLEFKNEEIISGFHIQFQGGFAGRNCSIWTKSLSGEEEIEKFYPDDNNMVQTFTLSTCRAVKEVKFLFKDSTDFFGRIVVYSLNILKV